MKIGQVLLGLIGQRINDGDFGVVVARQVVALLGAVQVCDFPPFYYFMKAKKRKQQPQPPKYFNYDTDNCYFCKNRNNCGGCKILKKYSKSKCE